MLRHPLSLCVLTWGIVLGSPAPIPAQPSKAGTSPGYGFSTELSKLVKNVADLMTGFFRGDKPQVQTDMPQVLRDFYAGRPPLTKSVEAMPDVLKDFYAGTKRAIARAASPARPATSASVARVQPPAAPSPPRPADQPATSLPGLETVGPFRFTLPENWQVHSRDAQGVFLSANGMGNANRFINFLRHPGLPNVAYRPAALNQAIFRLSRRGNGQFGTATVGKTKQAAAWTRSIGNGLVHEHVLFSHNTDVYMIASAYSAADESTRKALWRLIDSVEVAAPDDEFPPRSLPSVGRVSRYFDLNWDGDVNHQCVWAARQFAEKHLGLAPPPAGTGGAKNLWQIETPGFRKEANIAPNLPSPGSLIVWGPEISKEGYGHVAVALGTVNARTRIVRVIDSNWGSDYKGQIHDVKLNSTVRGWLIRE